MPTTVAHAPGHSMSLKLGEPSVSIAPSVSDMMQQITAEGLTEVALPGCERTPAAFAAAARAFLPMLTLRPWALPPEAAGLSVPPLAPLWRPCCGLAVAAAASLLAGAGRSC